MKVSNYTFLFDNDGRFYAYNVLTNSLLEFDSDLYEKLDDAYKNKKDVALDGEDEEVVNDLKINRIITDNQDDEFLIYKSIILRQRAERNSMHLTLAPTMNCCFRCHYCFEQTKEPGYMSSEVMDAIVKHVANHKELTSLRLTWFGGEPLMAIDLMEEFYEKLAPNLGGIKFSSNIITTGYHLNKHVIDVLKKIKVTSMQITLDGNKETHNKVKFLDECDDCFSKVLENIELTVKEYPEMHIVVRVNLTMDNAAEYADLHRYFLNKFKNNKQVAIAPAFVLDRNNGCSSSVATNLFQAKEYAKYILDLAHNGIDSPHVRYPGRYFSECAIRNDIAISFDPKGRAYKCWEVIGNEKYAIGKVNSDGNIDNVNVKVLNRQLYGADTLEDPACIKCRYLPLCNGGCPIQRIQNKFENGKNICCTYYKNHIKEFMLEHLRRKEMGFENK